MENLDHQNQGFNFNTFIEDSKNALLKPKEYFAHMPTSGRLVEPIIKAVIYGTIIGLFAFLWTSLGFKFATGSAWLGGGVGFMALVGSIIFSIIGLFIGGVIMLIISSILGGSSDYESNLRVVASLMVVNAVGGIFTFMDGLSPFLQAIVDIVFSLWGLWMTYHALVQTLKAKEGGSKILMLIFGVLTVIFSFMGIAAQKAIDTISDNYGLENFDKMSEKEQQIAILKSLEKISDGEINAEEVNTTLESAKDVLENSFTVEMADGSIDIKPDDESIANSINGVNIDNDFIILSSMDGFIQAAINDVGNFSVEYKDESGHYSSLELQNKNLVISMFTKYLHNDKSFKEECEWEDFE